MDVCQKGSGKLFLVHAAAVSEGHRVVRYNMWFSLKGESQIWSLIPNSLQCEDVYIRLLYIFLYGHIRSLHGHIFVFHLDKCYVK